MMAAPAAMAVTISAGDEISLTGWNPDDASGIMTYSVTNSTGSFDFSTFCIQNATYIWPSTVYTVGNITINVGNTVTPSMASSGTALNGTPLNGAVDYLYYLYSIGKFDSSFNPSTTVSLSQALLNQADFQQLLWYAQGESTYLVSLSGTVEQAWDESTPETVYVNANNAWYKDYLAYENPANKLQGKSYGTEVLNIIDSSGIDVAKGGDIQNQLVYQPVPEPSTFLLFGAGIAGVAFFRKRIKT
jgi:hypothetical protein